MKLLLRAMVAFAAIGLAGCATVAPTPREAIPHGAPYVALGSSFAAGAGIGPVKPDTPPRCQRTAINYATLLAQRLGLALTDVTCGGAMTAHVLGPWGELPAQIESLTPDTRLVTITIGGNDLGYVAGLMGGSCRAGASFRPGPCFPNALPSEETYVRVGNALREIARQIAARAPRATLVFVQYVTLVPPQPCEAAVLIAEDAAISAEIGRRLAAITAQAARESGALMLPADELSRDHTACSDQPWSSGMSQGYDMARGAPWHPTPQGMRGIAEALAARLAR